MVELISVYYLHYFMYIAIVFYPRFFLFTGFFASSYLLIHSFIRRFQPSESALFDNELLAGWFGLVDCYLFI